MQPHNVYLQTPQPLRELEEQPPLQHQKRRIKTKYLSIDQRIDLIKQIQKGLYVVQQKQGSLQQKYDKSLYTDHCRFIDVLEKLADIKDLGSGTYGKASRVCFPKEQCAGVADEQLPSEYVSYSIKEVNFNNIGTYNNLIDNPDRYENVEVRMLQLLSGLVFSHATPHINLPIMTFVCNPSPHLSDAQTQMYDLTTKRIIVSELANLGDMHHFVSNTAKKWERSSTGELIWKVMLFQILSVLATIQEYYPNFLHNDLKPDNILVKSTSNRESDNKFFQYRVGGKTFYVPDVGFQLLIWDFDFATIAGTIDNDKLIVMIDDKDANLVAHKNQYYDLRMCIGTLYRYWSEYMPTKIHDWIQDHVLTDKIPCSEHDERPLESIQYTTPAQLLSTKLFSQFTLIPQDKNSTKHIIVDTYTGQLDDKVKYNFPDEQHRYTNPKNCEYQNYIFLDPIQPTGEQQETYHNRYKCTIASKQPDVIKTLDSSLMSSAKHWIEYILNKYEFQDAITKKERINIVQYALEMLKRYCSLYYITKSTFHSVVTVSLMYSSYHTLLSYVAPFNSFSTFYKLFQKKAINVKHGELEDIFKQYCAFVALHIERV